ncbi:MAG: UDP-N-acetylmuramoyl-tripeptide--D-alanyl-D-alanine ligase [Nocardioidaceae bacterium]
MLPLTLAELAAVVGGELHRGGENATASTAPGTGPGLRRGAGARQDASADTIVVTGPAYLDSRLVTPGSLFAAFEGEYADGHEYAAAAAERGAAAVLGSRPTGVPTVVVPDVRAALQTLAHDQLDRLRAAGPLQVVAVTGSQGKTSAKDLLGAVLADAAPTVATEGSFNNELGLPLTVLRADASTRYLVLEMGARGIGHLAELCAIARPDVSVVLNVGKAHLGEFGSYEAIAQAKGELVEALSAAGVAVLNADDPAVLAMAARTAARITTFGEAPTADVRLHDLRLDLHGRPSFQLTTAQASAAVSLRLVGEHQAANAAGVAAAALGLGLGLGQVARSLAAVTAISRWRMEVTERSDGVTVVNDSYNANPDSMRAALKALAAIGRARGPGARTVAVLGEMRELGESSRDEHDAIGRLAVRLDIHRLVVVGEPAKAMHLGAHLEGSWGEESVFVPDNDAATRWLDDNLRAGDVVLLKASRGGRLDEVAAHLLRADLPRVDAGTDTGIDTGTGDA